MLSEIFEKVYVINLERRQERVKEFFDRLPTDWPFKRPVRYEALDGGIVSPPDWWNGGNGAWGCYKTHLRILEDCLNHGTQSVLILEDDAICVEGFCGKVKQFQNHLPEDWEMIYLGGQHIQENIRLPRKINDWVYHPFNVNRCHCYGFRGRRMIERAYRHLNDFSQWKVDHHVDHYLGELHKVMECGLYVPREWLVAQSEGQSDICGDNLKYRLFPGSEETVFPTIDLPCVGIMGNYFSGINTIAGMLHELGLYLGRDLGKPEAENDPQFYEEVYLGEICRNSYSEPWLEEKLSAPDRINHLRRWAGLQCREKPEQVKVLCGKHPILSLMGEDIWEAWNKPKIICVERPDEESYESMKQVPWCWHPQAAKYGFELLQKTRERFFENRNPELLRISYSDIKQSPEKVLNRVCEFLHHEYDSEHFHKATSFLERNQNEICHE